MSRTGGWPLSMSRMLPAPGRCLGIILGSCWPATPPRWLPECSQTTFPVCLSMMKMKPSVRGLTRMFPGLNRSSPASYHLFSGSGSRWLKCVQFGDGSISR